MSLDDGAADRQPHPCPTGLRGVEGVEDSIEMRRINAGPRIADSHEGVCMVLLGADRQLSYPFLNRAHCFSRVQNQVQQDLLQLNAIPKDRKQSIRKPGLDRGAILEDCASRQYKHLINCRIKIKTLLSGRRFLDVIAYAADDVSGSIGIGDDAAERLLDLPEVRRLLVQKIQSRASVVTRARDRLRDFVRQRSSEFSHHTH